MDRRRSSIWTCRARSFRCVLRARSPFACPFPPSMRLRRASRPNTIGQEAWNEANAPDEPEFMSNALFSTDQFTGRDKLAEAGSVRRTGSSKRSRSNSDERPAEEPHRARRRRSTKVSAESDHASKQDSQEKKQDKQASRSSSSKRKPRRRSDQKTGEAKQGKQSAERSAKHQKAAARQRGGERPAEVGSSPWPEVLGLRAKPQKQASSSGPRQQGRGRSASCAGRRSLAKRASSRAQALAQGRRQLAKRRLRRANAHRLRAFDGPVRDHDGSGLSRFRA